jgi:glycosyltransferase involved in cell wall biosynthesis
VTYAGEERRPGESVLLQRECARLGIGEVVKFLGHLPVAELRRRYFDVDAVCLPSYREGLPPRRPRGDGDGTTCYSLERCAVPDVVVEG